MKTLILTNPGLNKLTKRFKNQLQEITYRNHNTTLIFEKKKKAGSEFKNEYIAYNLEGWKSQFILEIIDCYPSEFCDYGLRVSIPEIEFDLLDNDRCVGLVKLGNACISTLFLNQTPEQLLNGWAFNINLPIMNWNFNLSISSKLLKNDAKWLEEILNNWNSFMNGLTTSAEDNSWILYDFYVNSSQILKKMTEENGAKFEQSTPCYERKGLKIFRVI